MKVISKRLLNRKSAAYVENIHAERNILVRVRHPFVVMMHAVSFIVITTWQKRSRANIVWRETWDLPVILETVAMALLSVLVFACLAYNSSSDFQCFVAVLSNQVQALHRHGFSRGRRTVSSPW